MRALSGRPTRCIAGWPHLQLRVHLLRQVRRRDGKNMPELQRRAPAAPGSGGMTMAVDEIEGFVRRFEAAWTAQDPALMQALFHPDAVVRQPPVREPFRGDQVADYFTQVFAGIPGLQLVPVDWT